MLRATFCLVLARTALVSFVTLAFLLGASVGHLAIQERNWPARIVLLVVLIGVWCSYFALAAAHARRPRHVRQPGR